MQKLNIYFGKWFGTPVWIHWSCWLYFILLSFSDIAIVPILFVVFGIVLLHEFGHMFVGKYFSIKTEDVTLYLFGGCANMEVPAEPKKEFFIALGGPLVNILLILPLYAVCGFSEFFWNVYCVNLAILFFNLCLPCFPLDGGRIFRSILCLFFNRLTSTVIAVRVSQILCILGFALACYISAFNLIIIAVLIFASAEAELFMMKQKMKNSIPDIRQSSDEIFRDSQNRFLALEQNLRNIREKYNG